ncbi:MAG: Rpn family recombination-promoting nuclease/putative transposase, partial [Prevotellaceae bacterium]|nr:Rpn family recombination-promoting nuclease/putative transposase [Prevotellaceae bacterium]
KDEPSEKWDYKLNPVYEIIITDAPVFHDEESKDVPVEWVQLMRLHGNVPFSDKVNLIFVDLSKANKTAEDLKTVLDFWLYTFKHAGHLLALPEQMMNNSTFVKLYNKLLRVDNLNQKDMKAYKKSVLDLETMRTYLDDGQERAEARGIAIGEARGVAIGEAIGEARGESRGEANALTAFVFSCAAMGISIKDIAILTKLSVEQVKAILQNR